MGQVRNSAEQINDEIRYDQPKVGLTWIKVWPVQQEPDQSQSMYGHPVQEEIDLRFSVFPEYIHVNVSITLQIRKK